MLRKGSGKRTVVQVGQRQIELTNLSKLLYPQDDLTKAHVVEYYLQIAPTILSHLKGRPLSLLRFPEGIGGEAFFQKNRPEWSPDWLEHAVLGEEQKDYIIATEPASLVWLANLACLELHQMHSRAPLHGKPDYIVYDLDPPQDSKFADVAEIALEFKAHVESFGYHAFVKTTGRKGLHIVTPIEPKWGVDSVFEACKEVAKPFVDSHASRLTLQLKKENRKGKILLDIYRNRQSQTIVAAYSLRGVPGAAVSTPLQWEELELLEGPGAFTLNNIPQRLEASGDPWETFSGYATAIHTAKKTAPSLNKRLKPSRSYKTPEQLKDYASKRSFDKTSEPPASQLTHGGSAFVVHRHHASRLHYDLRLERGGILRSWAVPKGLPPRPGIKRLAISVEDHPLDYVNFEGAIPKGEYGGGQMWRFARGRHEITKEKKDGFYFRLQSPELNAEYRVHNTKDNQWLLERVDVPQIDWLRSKVEPMLARSADQPPGSADYLYEVKWDGIRAMIVLDEGAIKIRGRNGMDLTEKFPELLKPELTLRATSGLFDGEIVCLDVDGKPNFARTISRMQQTNPAAIERARVRDPAVCYVFDCLYLDGRAIVNEPLSRRREWIADIVKSGGSYRISEAFEDGQSLFEAVRNMGLEGIMAKVRTSAYVPGKRSDSWLKVKTRHTMECVILGYSPGKGDRQGGIGALHLAQVSGDDLHYVGRVGSGFSGAILNELGKTLKALTAGKEPANKRGNKIISREMLYGTRSVWVEPKLMCEVQYASTTKDGMLREPVFIRLRPDLSTPD